jgi:phosphatidylglycerophosphatase A
VPVRRSLGLPLWHPAVLVATWFGVGFIPITPGSWGSLAALPFAWAIINLWGITGLGVATALAFIVGWMLQIASMVPATLLRQGEWTASAWQSAAAARAAIRLYAP